MKRTADFALELKGDEARDWLRYNFAEINAKWKHIEIKRSEDRIQQYRDEKGAPSQWTCPAHYTITYYRSRFRFFGKDQSVVVQFSEADICSVSFRKESEWAFWDATYYVHIGLTLGSIHINYHPPFYGATPIANAQHSEDLLISLDLHLRPKEA